MATYMRLEEQVDSPGAATPRKRAARRRRTALRRARPKSASTCFGEARKRAGAVGGLQLG